MPDTIPEIRVDLYFHPADAAALLSIADGTTNGTGIHIHGDDEVERTYVRVVVDYPEYPAEKQGIQLVHDFDTLTAALITLGHNVAGDLESTKPWARTNADGVNLLDTPEGKAAWDSMVGIERPEALKIAVTHAAHEEFQQMLAAIAEGEDVDDDPDTTLEGRAFIDSTDHGHHHPETLTEHGGEG